MYIYQLYLIFSEFNIGPLILKRNILDLIKDILLMVFVGFSICKIVLIIKLAVYCSEHLNT